VFPPTKKYKRPESVLVVIYTLTGKVLLLRRADDPDFWQSVTGSLLWEESDPRQAATRELREETGLDVADGLRDLGIVNRYSILPRWRPRYAPEVSENKEYVFALALPAETAITLNPAEHDQFGWFTFESAVAMVFSRTNRAAIETVKERRE